MRFLPIVMALLLSGCAQVAAEALADAAALHAAARARVHENFEYRRMIRAACMDSVKREIDKAGSETEKRQLLARAYPPLITFAVAKAAGEDPTSIGSKAHVCGE